CRVRRHRELNASNRHVAPSGGRRHAPPRGTGLDAARSVRRRRAYDGRAGWGARSCGRRRRLPARRAFRVRHLRPDASWRGCDRGSVRARGRDHGRVGPGHGDRIFGFSQGGGVRHALAAGALVGASFSLQITAAGATPPTPCPTPAAASGSRVTGPAAPVDAYQAALDLLKSRLGGDLARALDAQNKLDPESATLDLLIALI